MKTRHEYFLKLAGNYQFPIPDDDYELRHPTQSDLDDLGALTLDSYHGTIDYEDETLDQCREEMTGNLDGKYGESLAECSWLLYSAAEIAAACLVVRWQGEKCAFITFVMTGSKWKGKGLATVALQSTLASLKRSGFQEVRAVITDGNEPSERLFKRAGFAWVEKEGDSHKDIVPDV
jgi:RimJ/RimL family protein N-acetyltransferase